MIIEKKHNGYLIYTTVNGYLLQRFYSGYNLTEAKKLFRAEKNNHK
jgi:hypothetical protein